MKLNLTLLVAGFAILGIIGEAEGCPAGWTAGSAWSPPFLIYKCYRHFNYQKTWRDAENYCKSQDSSPQYPSGHLVMINSVSENNLVNGLASQAGVNTVWIGFNDIDSENQFRWTSNWKRGYNKWGRGQPDNWFNGYEREDCTMFWTNGGYWNDLGCNSKMTFVCVQ